MEEFLEQDLDIYAQKIINMEKNVASLEDQIDKLTESLKETQKFIVKLAYNQQEITKRISQWPYLVVSHREDDNTA